MLFSSITHAYLHEAYKCIKLCTKKLTVNGKTNQHCLNSVIEILDQCNRKYHKTLKWTRIGWHTKFVTCDAYNMTNVDWYRLGLSLSHIKCITKHKHNIRLLNQWLSSIKFTIDLHKMLIGPAAFCCATYVILCVIALRKAIFSSILVKWKESRNQIG